MTPIDVRPTTVLLVEYSDADARRIQQALTSAGDDPFHVERVTCLAAALARLAMHSVSERLSDWQSDPPGSTGIDVVLLDLTLPDGQGLEAFDRISAAAPDTLIVVLSEQGDEETAHKAMQRGAHDYLAKVHIDARWLPRALRYIRERKIAEDALRLSELRFRAMSDASPLGIFVSDAQGDCVYTNAAYHKISGLTFDETLGTNWSRAIHPEDRERVLVEWREAAAGRAPFQSEVRFCQDDGSIVWTRLHAAPMSDGTDRRSIAQGHVQTVENITDRKSSEAILHVAEEALFEEKERAQVTLNSIGDAVLSTDIQGNITYLNLVAEAMTGWSLADALGRPLAEVFVIINGTTRRPSTDPARKAMEQNQTVGLDADSVLIRRDGRELSIEDSAAPIHNRRGEVSGAVLVFHDVSESRAITRKMAHLAQHDFLTDLPNRALLTERLSQAIGQANRHGKQVALLFLDLDNFKRINDSLGHAIGDQLLQSVASRLTACVRTTDTVCRQGGDEFVILLAEIEQPGDATHIVEKVLANSEVPHRIGGYELHVTLSIGVSVYPDDGTDVETVMQNSDTAMYHAKARGRNNSQFFRADMNTRAVQRLSVEGGLRRALEKNEFVLHFQPQIELATGAITAAEALVRWQDPDLGLISPMTFLPVAEECGLIVPIGRWVMREACRQVRAWLDAGLRAVPVAINISSTELVHRGFLEGVISILKETGLAPHYLELELTESVLMHNAESAASVLGQLKIMGVRLAIDDFGTGYSSLNYLKHFPVDTLKIDASFVRDILTDADDATIVSAVIGMGINLKQRVIAEGVETPEQLAFLRTRNCAEGQGFHFSHPLSAEDFAQILVDDVQTMALD